MVAVAHLITHTTTLKELRFTSLGYGFECNDAEVTVALNKNHSLEVLDLSGISCISDLAARHLAHFIVHAKSLTLLCLNLAFNACGALDIATALCHKPDLKQQNHDALIVRHCGPSDMIYFLRLQRDFPEMLCLYPKVVGIDDAAVESIAKFLLNDATVEELYLNNNIIRDLGAQHLSSLLYANFTLVDLCLSGNKIGDAGVEFLAQALCCNSTLKALDLSRNRFGDRGAKALAEALFYNSSLERLDLNANRKIGEEGVFHLVHTLSQIINRGSHQCCGVVLNRLRCETYALKCSGYSRVKHKFSYL
jgi:Ran GTPase-activating protein (RanGAP) involved in mRNA processing and transport